MRWMRAALGDDVPGDVDGDAAEFLLHVGAVDQVLGEGFLTAAGDGLAGYVGHLGVAESPAEGGVPGAHLRPEALAEDVEVGGGQVGDGEDAELVEVPLHPAADAPEFPDRPVVHHLPPVRAGQPIDAGHLEAAYSRPRKAQRGNARASRRWWPAWRGSCCRRCRPNRSGSSGPARPRAGRRRAARDRRSPRRRSTRPSPTPRPPRGTSAACPSPRSTPPRRRPDRTAGRPPAGTSCTPPAPASPSARRTRVPRTTRSRPPAVVASDRPTHRPPPATRAAQAGAGSPQPR